MSLTLPYSCLPGEARQAKKYRQYRHTDYKLTGQIIPFGWSLACWKTCWWCCYTRRNDRVSQKYESELC
jgi:hypothetical protein